ncbi:histidine kinase [bacterium]|jgi:LytS/YehU family sensor histidine kinase|nr:histidine kinase [bacterium]
MLFAGTSDLAYPPVQRFFRFFFRELSFLPWKIIPFYALFYFLVPKYFQKGNYWKISFGFLGSLVICLLGYRSMISPASNMMYGEIPAFNVYDLKRFIYSLTFDMLPAIGLASTIKLLKGRMAFSKKEEALKKEKLEAELNFLKAQTNPHFLFNTLNNLYGLARMNDQNTAPSIMKLANIMRFILHECSVPTIPIDKEIKIIEDYIELESLRYDDRLTVNFEKNIENVQSEIAPLILLPFVENAFKHGVGETRFEAVIDIALELQDRKLKFTIKNSKDEDQNTVNQGIGLKNVKRQLELIYGENYSLEIESESKVFFVKLTIQLSPHEE